MTALDTVETCFAHSKYTEILHGEVVLGFVLADTVLRVLIDEGFAPPENNPIIQQLMHEAEPFITFEEVTETHERECLAYIQAHLEWKHIGWHLQCGVPENYGAIKMLLETGKLMFRFAEEQAPPNLYKYTSSRNADHFIADSTISLSAPTKFNDPFDCPFNGPVRERMEKIGISCFSDRNDNVVMFSHYADEHRGVCLVFDLRYFKDLTNRWDINVGGRVQRVVYYDRFPVFDEKIQDAKIATAKHRNWSYESEYRLFTTYAYPSGLYTIDHQALVGVIFGVRTPDDEKERIYRLADKAGRSLEFFQAEKIPNSYSLSIIPVEFDRRKLVWCKGSGRGAL